jgi:hypothetical protein
MKGLLVRVGIDTTYGRWNAPCRADGSFCYVPMQPKEKEEFDQGFETTYCKFEEDCQEFAQESRLVFPNRLRGARCHLDPDFRFSSYGAGQMAERISTLFGGSLNNFIAFYASFEPIDNNRRPLVYAIIGLFRFHNVVWARDVPLEIRGQNAHTRLAGYRREDNQDLVIFAADKDKSGRLRKLIPIGEQHDNQQYYVREQLLQNWGGISTKNGWIQRSGPLPEFCDPYKFLQWFDAQNPQFVHENNIVQ